jgi:probable non-F420 flavinoid oxidoreductase
VALLGYHCSHEQYSPSQLLRHAKSAAQAGFRHAMCSDHFHPWSIRQGQSGFAWSWLGAALEAMPLSLGTVNAPGQRYHPAVIAQAAATLADMYPKRFWLSVGSGEALNEMITGAAWPRKQDRKQRLNECIDVIRALWRGETVDHQGLVTVHGAKLYSLPATPPKLIAACLTEDTARWAGQWADGLVTVSQDKASMKAIVDAFREGGGDGKPMYLQVVLSFAPTREEAAQAAHHEWRQACLDKSALADLDSPQAFDSATASVRRQDMENSIRISDSIAQQADWLAQDAALGFERLYLHNVHRDQQRFVSEFAEHVMPRFT